MSSAAPLPAALPPAFVWASVALALVVALGAGGLAHAAAQRREAGRSRVRVFARTRPLLAALVGGALVGVAGVTAFAALARSWQHEGALDMLDRQVNAALVGVPPALLAVLGAVTHLADAPVLWAASLAGMAVLWRQGKRCEALALALAMGGGNTWMWTLKQHFARVRPENAFGLDTYAFPSGHATGAMLLYGFAAWYVATREGRVPARAGLVALLALVPLAVGASRVGLSVHWVSDVVGGRVLGLSWLVLSLGAAWAAGQRSSPPASRSASRKASP